MSSKSWSQAERAWNRLAKRGWLGILTGPIKTGPPFQFILKKQNAAFCASGRSRAEAVKKTCQDVEALHEQ